MSRKWGDRFPALAPSMSLVIPLITAKKFRSRICQVNSYERKRQSLISHLSPKRKELKVSWHIWGHRGIVVAVPFLAFAFLWLTIRWTMNHAIRPAGVSKIPKRGTSLPHIAYSIPKENCAPWCCVTCFGYSGRSYSPFHPFIYSVYIILFDSCVPDSVELQTTYECMHYNNLISWASMCTAHYKMWQDN